MKKYSWNTVGWAIVLGLFTAAGCETESTDHQITIEPSTAVLTEGESVEFTARGGYEYTWSLEDDDDGETWAILSTRRGNSAVYTSVRTPTSNLVTRVLTVTSTPDETAGEDAITNEWTAEAYILHY